jgi:hypothetical protein
MNGGDAAVTGTVTFRAVGITDHVWNIAEELDTDGMDRRDSRHPGIRSVRLGIKTAAFRWLAEGWVNYSSP